MTLKLIRYNYDVNRTQGIFLIDGVYYGDSLELPWKENKHDISCIPEGVYKINHGQMTDSLDGYELASVRDRFGIWIHPASIVSQLKGCIGTGIKFGDDLWHNTKTFVEIYSKIGASGELTIEGIK